MENRWTGHMQPRPNRDDQTPSTRLPHPETSRSWAKMYPLDSLFTGIASIASINGAMSDIIGTLAAIGMAIG
jgi:hypothetical protein